MRRTESALWVLSTWLAFTIQVFADRAVMNAHTAMERAGQALPAATRAWEQFSSVRGPLVVAIVGTAAVLVLSWRRDIRVPGWLAPAYGLGLVIYLVASFAACIMPLRNIVNIP